MSEPIERPYVTDILFRTVLNLLSPAASLSPGQRPLWAVKTLQSLEPKYGTVCL